MASKTAHPSKPIEEMVTSLKTDNTNPIPAKDSALSDAASCISSVDAVCSTKENESDQEAFMAEQSLYYPMNGYYGYPYPGYEMQFGEWNEQCYMVGGQAPAMMQQPLDAGQLVYYSPGFQPGSNSYSNSFVPGPVFGVDGQYLGQQPYGSCPITPQPQPFGSPVYFPHSMCYGPEMMPTYGQDASFWEFNNGNGYTGSLTLPTIKSKYPSKTQPSRHMTANSKSPTVENMGLPPVLDHPPRVDLQNPPTKSVNKTFVPSKGFLPLPKSQFYSRQGKSSMLYPSTPSSNKEIRQILVGTEKAKPRSKLNGSGDPDLLNEQNRGPRTNPSRNALNSGAGVPVVDLEDNPSHKTVLIKKDDYNLSDFPVKYEQAFFFVIKSYSEDDIHKSIKYNVWASTPNGNKRLDGAFQTAQDQMKEKGCACPVFLFFSVNASGQFCGVAEMIGRVDFNKNMDFWQQDKWNGYFPVKWHIIKDVPNPQFRHIILENNDNKPVTNSRDTQEVKFPKGSDMLKIFKYFSSKTSILDDFGFYESRQKVMLDKRAKTSDAPLDNFQQKLEPANVKRSEESEDTEPIVSSMEALQLGSEKTINDDTQFNVEQ